MDESPVDVAVIGSGLAGMMASLEADGNGARVALLTRGALGAGNSERASGGLAAVTGIDPEDSPQQHLADMERAARGLMFSDVAETFVVEAGDAIRRLERLGVRLARGPDDLRLFMAPGHSRARSIRCEGGGTTHLMAPLAEAVRARPIRIVEGVDVVDIERDEAGAVSAVVYIDGENRRRRLFTRAVVLACGGLGQLFPLTSNCPQATGSGYYLALKAGAILTDLEFVQFTPTSLAYPPEVRGISTGGGLLAQKGVRLLNARHDRFMPHYDERAEAATRDVVARAIYREVQEGRGTNHNGVYVDMSATDRAAVAQVSGRFLRAMERVGIDPYSTLVEVAPDVHFAMGGVAVDANGWTGVPGLYAAGEIAAGLHGATRLNSNGLTEATVFGLRAGKAAALGAEHVAWDCAGGRGSAQVAVFVAADPRGSVVSAEVNAVLDLPRPGEAPVADNPSSGDDRAEAFRIELRLLLSNGVGIERTGEQVTAARRRRAELAAELPAAINAADGDGQRFDLAAAYVMTGLLLKAVELRTESRGAHFRVDHPAEDDNWRTHICFSLVESDNLGGGKPCP